MRNTFLILFCLAVTGLGAQNLSKGFDALDAKDFATAKTVFEKAVASDATDLAALTGMTRFYIAKGNKEGDPEKANEYLEKAERVAGLLDEKGWGRFEKFGMSPAQMRDLRLSVERRFLSVIDENPDEAKYNEWIERFPNSAAMENGVKARNRVAAEKAKAANTIESYTSFLNKYPKADEAKSLARVRDELALRKAKDEGSSDAFRDFMTRYPDSELFTQAEQNLHTVAYDEAKAAGTSAALRGYAREFPKSVFTKLAETAAAELEADGK